MIADVDVMGVDRPNRCGESGDDVVGVSDWIADSASTSTESGIAAETNGETDMGARSLDGASADSKCWCGCPTMASIMPWKMVWECWCSAPAR